MPTAAVLIIGDEILTGKFADENGPFAIRRLRELGCDLGRVAVLRDVIGEIAAEVARSAREFDIVLTTGGVGPTHDDVTFEGVAAGLGLPLELRPELLGLIRHYGLPENPASLRMATVPAGAELVGLDRPSDVPVLHVANVYIFPGVPRLFQRKFELVAARFAGELVATARLATPAEEVEIAAHLGDVQRRWPGVAIGSYPRYEGDRHVLVTLESRDRTALSAAFEALASGLPSARVVQAPDPAVR
jgi:molybdenum cofactor synthesis domain-containing protein